MAFLHVAELRILASIGDDKIIDEATPTDGCVHLRRRQAAVHGARRFRQAADPCDHTRPALKKTICSVCGVVHRGWYDRRVQHVRDLSCGVWHIVLELEVRRVACRSCGHVKREHLSFLADNPSYTKRFAYYVGRRCRQSTIKEIADELRLDWHTVKTLDMQYMRAQLVRAGRPAPKAIGIDEISIRKGHTYRIVVSDLIRRRPIWFGGPTFTRFWTARRPAWRSSTRGSARTRRAASDWR